MTSATGLNLIKYSRFEELPYSEIKHSDWISIPLYFAQRTTRVRMKFEIFALLLTSSQHLFHSSHQICGRRCRWQRRTSLRYPALGPQRRGLPGPLVQRSRRKTSLQVSNSMQLLRNLATNISFVFNSIHFKSNIF